MKRYYKKLDVFDDYNIYNILDNIKIKSLYNKINNKTALFVSTLNNNCYAIIHRSTKSNMFQLSFFKNDIAISDIIRNSYYEIIKEIITNYNNYKLKEVIK